MGQTIAIEVGVMLSRANVVRNSGLAGGGGQPSDLIDIKSDTSSEMLFRLGFFVILFSLFASKTLLPYGAVVSVSLWGGIGCCALTCLFKERTESIYFVLILGIVSALVAFRSHEVFPILTWAVLCGVSRRTTYSFVAKTTAFASALVFCMTVGLNRIGRIPTVYWNDTIGDRPPRSAMGFAHPNNAGMVAIVFLFSIFVLLSLWESRRLSILIYSLCAGVVGVFCDKAVDSRTSYVICLFSIVLFILVRVVDRTRHLKLLRGMGLVLGIGPMLASVAVMVFYENPWIDFDKYNKLFSGRLLLSNYYYNDLGLSFFGNNENVFGQPVATTVASGTPLYFVVDNAYAHILLRTGIVLAIVLLYFVMRSYRYAIHIQEVPPFLWAGLLCTAIGGITETYFISVVNVFIVCVAICLKSAEHRADSL